MTNYFLLTVPFALVLAGCTTSPAALTKPAASQSIVYQTNFEQNPFEAGWYWDKATWEKKAGKPGTALWVDRKDDGKCIEVRDGMWRSPKISVEPLSFYRVKLEAKTGANCYWGLLSYDDKDVEIPASPYCQVPASDDWQTNGSAVLIPEDAIYSRVLLWPMKSPLLADNVVVEKLTRKEALGVMDSIYQEIPKVDPAFADKTQTGLSNTAKALKQDGELTIMLIGDSVANDMGNSNFHLLLEQKYPKARVTLLNKVGSGASAKSFLENDKIDAMLEEHDPDLVMFGGMSNRENDVPDIKKLARRVQARGGTDFLAFTGTMLMPRYWTNIEGSQTHRKPYREALKGAGGEIGFAVCDLGGAWEEYVKDAGKPVEFFRRDGHHANEYGKQAYGRLMAAYLLSAMR